MFTAINDLASSKKTETARNIAKYMQHASAHHIPQQVGLFLSHPLPPVPTAASNGKNTTNCLQWNKITRLLFMAVLA